MVDEYEILHDMKILGLMSGTSLDGVDLALCDIDEKSYSIEAAQTVPYPPEWRQRLSTLEHVSAVDYIQAHVELGHFFGQIINDFVQSNNLHVDAVASHGHTIFHQPERSFTAQIGDGDAIAAETGLLVVCNFRSLDVALGGQGAPLVPIGDELLFGDYDACLNLGGIANVSYRVGGKRIAYDICPCNMALNRLASELGFDYDRDGENARRGLLDYYLNETLNCIEYYRVAPPKSLGKEWFVETFWPVVEASSLSVVDKLRTVTQHVAVQIADVLTCNGVGRVLVTGGGALNRFLVERIAAEAPAVDVVVPDSLIVNYKEALIFALLGYLRLGGKVNTLSTVTGARCDSVGGDVCGLVPRQQK